MVELNPSAVDTQKMQKMIREKGIYSGEKTLKDDVEKEVNDIISCWKTGDEEGINRLIFENPLKEHPDTLPSQTDVISPCAKIARFFALF